MDRDWREMPGAQLPGQLHAAVSLVFRRWGNDMPVNEEYLDWSPIPLEEDYGKDYDAWHDPPFWNGRVYFSLWYAWEWGGTGKFERELGELKEDLRARPSLIGSEYGGAALCGTPVLLNAFCNDWYDCAPYVSVFRQHISFALDAEVDWEGERHPRKMGLEPCGDRIERLGTDPSLCHELASALCLIDAKSQRRADTLAHALVRVTLLTKHASQLIEGLAAFCPTNESALQLDGLCSLLLELEMAMADAVKFALVAEELLEFYCYVSKCEAEEAEDQGEEEQT